MPANNRRRGGGDGVRTARGREPDDTVARRGPPREASWLVSLLVIGLLLFGWCWLASLRVVAKRSQPPDNLGAHSSNDALRDLERRGMRFLTPANGEVDVSIIDGLRATDNLDVFGQYMPTNRSANGAPVYAKVVYVDSFDEEDYDIIAWHIRGGSVHGQWYIGPKDRIGTGYGIVKANVQGWDPRGVPVLPVDGWEVATIDVHATANTRWLKSGVRFLSAGQLADLLYYAAFRVLAPVDTEGRSRMFEYMGEIHYGRPRYRTTADGKGKRLDLWWSENLESWCIGPAKDAERQGMQLSSLTMWQFCHLRAIDPALLAEWIRAPWQALDPRWRTYKGAEQPSIKNGMIRIGREVPSFTYVDGQVLQLPLTSTLVTLLSTHQVVLRLVFALAAISLVATRHSDQLIQAWTSILASVRRGAGPRRRRPRPARQPRAQHPPAQAAPAPDAPPASKEDEGALCCVCLSEPKTHLLLPCGHKCLCQTCVADFATDGATCPLCREQVDGAARVYE